MLTTCCERFSLLRFWNVSLKVRITPQNAQADSPRNSKKTCLKTKFSKTFFPGWTQYKYVVSFLSDF